MIKLPEPVDQVRIFDHRAEEYTTVQACDDYYTESQMRQAIKDATASQAAEIERLREATQKAKDWLEWFCGEPSLHPKIKASDLLYTLTAALENTNEG